MWVMHKAKKKKKAEMMKYVSEITYRRALQTSSFMKVKFLARRL